MYQKNEEFKKWKDLILKSQFCTQTLKDNMKTKYMCSKYSGPVKFNGIPR